ncbi:hypothetical protein [Ilumatobacter sp.]|uniref:hypothetical protein n=1 Tax=Ilumatobacter sp. TaxID=1967498 RepID=UPI003B526CB0
MSVRLDIPITVRLASSPRPVDLAGIKHHVGNAVKRAGDIAHSEVVGPRGRRRRVVVEPSSVIIQTADGAPNPQASRVEAAVLAGVDYGIESSGLLERRGTGIGVRGRASEPGDPQRTTARGYKVPVFDDGTDGEVPVAQPQRLTVGAVQDALWAAHVERFGPVWDPARFGYPGFYGTFLLDGRVVKNTLYFLFEVGAIDEDGLPYSWNWAAHDLILFDYDEENDRIITTTVQPPMGHYVLTRTEEAATTQNLLRLYNAEAQTRESAPEPEIRARMAAAANRPDALIHTLEDGERIRFISMGGGELEGVDSAIPIRFIAQMQLGTGESVEGSGGERRGGGRQSNGQPGGRRTGGSGEGEGGTRRGPRGGPLGRAGAEGEGRVWPVIGGGTEQLKCEAFLGEPPIADLTIGGAALERTIRHIAIQLELDYCGYAAKFCVNAALLIGARAHAIGVTSVNRKTTTRVSVQPNGGGNQGFIQIEPGDTPEFEYLQTLGELAVQVDNLRDLIGEVYLRPENAHQIFWQADRDNDPNAAAFLLRFFSKMRELDTSCMWLYAETCRVILLQQLRSSSEGITGRIAAFEETLASFTQKLDILGSSVVKMSVLRTAIRYADRMNVSGSVRSVLATPPPMIRMRGDAYRPPPPIDRVADPILAALEAATITDSGSGRRANFLGRAWTIEELDQAVAMRRGVLNMSDPMFLQIADLDALYTRFARNPDTARTYLWDLLDEMRRANTKMISETSDREDGPFFALEASQYVKAQGGYNNRGLKYDLTGIHEMADNILRGHTQGTDSYRIGINRAIGVKAGWDNFIMLFSTAGIIGLALLCAPLGALAVGVATGAAGLALTAYDISEADRLEDLYRALKDPEAILHWQDVELARMMANLSKAFSIFDVVGVGKGAAALVRTARTGLREVAEQGLRGTARSALAASRRQILDRMAAGVMENALKQAVMASALAGATTLLLPVVITPVLVPWMRRTAAEHGTLPEIDAALGALAAGQPAIEVTAAAVVDTELTQTAAGPTASDPAATSEEPNQ